MAGNAQLMALAIQILNGESVPPAVYMNHVFINTDNIDKHSPMNDESCREYGCFGDLRDNGSLGFRGASEKPATNSHELLKS
ncbi:MAG: hypothetical protein WAM60_03060 [Candidatus Promineifilaceae bacterium]